MKKEITRIIILLGSAVCFLACNKSDKTAYVDIEPIYNKYPLKTELESKLEQSQNQRSRLMDSLMNDLELLSIKVRENTGNEKLKMSFFEKRSDVEQFREKLEEQAAAEAESYRDQIWKQLNAYIRQYGDQHGYDYIFSSENSYNVLYYSESKDITKELDKYLQEKYKGI